MAGKKTFGIYAVAVHGAFTGINYLFAGSFWLYIGTLFLLSDRGSFYQFLFGLPTFIFGCYFIFSTYKFFIGKEWGRSSMFWLSLIDMPVSVLFIFYRISPGSELGAYNTIYQLLGVGIAMIIVFYLTRPSVKLLFNVENKTGEVSISQSDLGKNSRNGE